MANAGVGGGPSCQVLGCPHRGGLRREAETLTSLDPKPSSHSPSLPPGLTLEPFSTALCYDPFS